MGQGFGIEKPGEHAHVPHREPARWLIVIAAADASVARLFDAERHQVAELDASSEEVAVMTKGLVPSSDAGASAWDDALGGHTADERQAAEVYSLDV